MNLNLLQEKLMHAARLKSPPGGVPYAFEQRILARIRSEPMVDGLTLWGRALWRAALSCVVAMLVLAGWAFYTPNPAPASDTLDLAVQLETELMASVSIEGDLTW
jgi:hypothetical protein